MATWMQGSAVRAIGTLPDGIRLCFENAEVDVVLNHMAGPFVFSPEKDGQGRARHEAELVGQACLAQACGQSEDTEKSSTAKCGKPMPNADAASCGPCQSMQQKIGLSLRCAVGLGWAGTEPLP